MQFGFGFVFSFGIPLISIFSLCVKVESGAAGFFLNAYLCSRINSIVHSCAEHLQFGASSRNSTIITA